MPRATKDKPSPQPVVTLEDAAFALAYAIDQQAELGADDLLAPVVAAIKKRFPDLQLFDIELLLADARNEVDRTLAGAVRTCDLVAAFKSELEQAIDDV